MAQIRALVVRTDSTLVRRTRWLSGQSGARRAQLFRPGRGRGGFRPRRARRLDLRHRTGLLPQFLRRRRRGLGGQHPQPGRRPGQVVLDPRRLVGRPHRHSTAPPQLGLVAAPLGHDGARDDRDGAVWLFMRTVGLPALVVAVMRVLPFWKSLRQVAHTLPYDAAAMNKFELPSRLNGITVPTLVVGGGKSPAALKAAVRAVGEAVPRAQVVEIPGQSHAIQAAALSPVVLRFAQSG